MTNLMRKYRFVVLCLILAVGVILLFVPDHLGLAADSVWRRLLDQAGMVLITAIGLGIVITFFFKKHDDDEMLDRMSELLDSRFVYHRSLRERWGIAEVSDRMDFSAMFRDLGDGDELWWLDTYAPTYMDFINDLRGAVKRGCHVRMLILDPQCENAKHRALELGPDYLNRLQKGVADFIDAVAESFEAGASPPKGKLEHRIYSDLPCAPIYVIRRNGSTHKVYTSYFLGSPTGVQFPHLTWRPGQEDMPGEFFKFVRAKWDRWNPANA